MLRGDVVRKINRLRINTRALKTTQVIEGSAIPIAVSIHETGNYYVNPTSNGVGWAKFEITGHAVDANNNRIAIANNNRIATVELQAKSADHGWDNPLRRFTLTAASKVEWRSTVEPLGDDGAFRATAQVRTYSGRTEAVSFRTICVGNYGITIDNVVQS